MFWPPQGPGVRATGRRGPALPQCPDPGVLALGPHLGREAVSNHGNWSLPASPVSNIQRGRKAVPLCNHSDEQCGERSSVPLGQRPALLSKGRQHPFFLLFSQVLEVWSSVCPPVGWKHTWRCRHQVHVCRLEKACKPSPS